MVRPMELSSVFPALRLTGGQSSARFFMAGAVSIHYKGLPVCNIVDGPVIATDIDAEAVAEMFGPPTHYFIGSADLCWRLDSQGFARFKSLCPCPDRIAHVDPTNPGAAPTSRAEWPAPPRRLEDLDLRFVRSFQPHSACKRSGGGLLTDHIDFL